LKSNAANKQYDAWSFNAATEACDDTLTMAPPRPRSTMPRATSWESWNTDRRLTVITLLLVKSDESVAVDARVEVGERDIQERRKARDAGIVDEKIDLPSLVRNHLNLLLVRQVRQDCLDGRALWYIHVGIECR
jgi:hypothetical protein